MSHEPTCSVSSSPEPGREPPKRVSGVGVGIYCSRGILRKSITKSDTKDTPEGVFVLADQVWDEGHETGAFDGVGQFALVPDADAGAFARDDLAEGGQVAAQGVGVFVVHVLSVHLAKVTATVSLDHR